MSKDDERLISRMVAGHEPLSDATRAVLKRAITKALLLGRWRGMSDVKADLERQKQLLSSMFDGRHDALMSDLVKMVWRRIEEVKTEFNRL